MKWGCSPFPGAAASNTDSTSSTMSDGMSIKPMPTRQRYDRKRCFSCGRRSRPKQHGKGRTAASSKQSRTSHAARRDLLRGGVGGDGEGGTLPLCGSCAGNPFCAGDASLRSLLAGAVGAGPSISMSVSARSAICTSLSSLLTCSACQYPPGGDRRNAVLHQLLANSVHRPTPCVADPTMKWAWVAW